MSIIVLNGEVVLAVNAHKGGVYESSISDSGSSILMGSALVDVSEITDLVNFDDLANLAYSDDGVTLCEVGDPIKRLVNAGTLGGYLEQVTLGNRPTLELVNGVYVMRGYGDVMNSVGIDLTTTIGATLCLLAKKNFDDAGGYGHFGTDNYSTHSNYLGNVCYDSFGSTERHNFIGPAANWASWVRYVVTSTASEWTARGDGVQLHTTVSNTVAFRSTVTIFDGGPGLGYPFSGDIVRIRVSAPLTTEEIEAVEAEYNDIITDLEA